MNIQVEKHCLPCHEATEIYEKQFNRNVWVEIVRQMNRYDPEIVPEGKIKDIVDFLVNNQMSSQ